MPETLVSPQLLDDLIEGRLLSAPRMSEAAALARLAADCRQLRLPGPDTLRAARMRRRYAAYLNGEHAGVARWLFGWLGGGPMARPLRERLAAGVMIVAAAGGSASYATGVTPTEAIENVSQLAGSLLANLAPHDGLEGEIGVAPPTATPTGTPGAGETPTPAASTPEAVLPPPAGEAPLPTGQAAAPPPTTQAGTPPPSATGTPTATRTPTPPATASPTPTLPAFPPAGAPSLPAAPETTTPTPPPTATASPPSPTPSPSSTPTATPTPSPTPAATPTPTRTPEHETEDD